MPSKPAQKPAKKPAKTTKPKVQSADVSIEDRVCATLSTLKRLGVPRTRDEMGSRFGITGPTAETAFGVSMSNLKQLAKDIQKQEKSNHDLALALWETGNYEARLLTSLIDDPQLVTPAQMDRWCKDFDNWGICDTLCFNLFDRTSHAFDKITKWSSMKGEFQKRASFALLASVALHDKKAPDETFLRFLPFIKAASGDERNFVKKGVLWALRGVGARTPARKTAALKLAAELGSSKDPTARWIGKTAMREMSKK